MSESNAFIPGVSNGTAGALSSATETPALQPAGAPFDPVWMAAILLCVIVIATRRLTTANTLRERRIAGGHYKGQVEPKWYERFQKSEAVREDALDRTDLQQAIRTRRR